MLELQNENKFIVSLKKWKLDNEEYYNDFLDQLSSRDGYNVILKIVLKVYPIFLKKINLIRIKGSKIDLQELFTKDNTLEDIQSYFKKKITNDEEYDPYIYAFFYWFLHENPYEFVVNNAETIRADNRLSFTDKNFIYNVIKFIKKETVDKGYRTKDDWIKQEEHFNKITGLKAIPLNERITSKKKHPFDFGDDIDKIISNYLKYNCNAKAMAIVMISLKEHLLIDFSGNVKPFVIHLNEKLNIEVNPRGAQKEYKLLSETAQDKRDRSIRDEIENLIKLYNNNNK